MPTPTTGHYREPAVMTAPGKYQPLLADLPQGVAALAGVAHGLLIHEHIAGVYGVTLTDERRASVHVRPVAALLERMVADDSRPLPVPREPAARLPGNCRHFSVLTAAMLRAQGTPARVRCGFGGYFGTGTFEDHWVCEYWDEAARRWKLADAQIDDVQLGLFEVDFDLMDVPRGAFLVAGDAWRPAPDEAISDEQCALFDRLAGLTRDPDAAFAELTAAYAGDARLRVPATVYNAVLNRPEPVLP